MSKGLTSIQKNRATVVVGLDFGTTFSGFAWALQSEPDKVHKFYEWPSLKEAGGRNYCKTETSLLYASGASPGSYVLQDWAYSALALHARSVNTASLRKSGPKSFNHGETKAGLDIIDVMPRGSPISSASAKLHYLTKFKLHLAASTDSCKSAKDLPPGLTPRRVISDYLAKLSELILTSLKESAGNHISMEDIQWCITVPAVWNEEGKQEMITCAEIAGLVLGPACAKPDASPHPCIIVLEPEAASIYCQRNVKLDVPFKSGDKFLVVDVGGGTVDLVLHEKVGPDSNVKVKEISASSGGLCGGTFVDQAFLNFLSTKISCFQAIFEEHAASILEVKGKWEDIKYRFTGNDLFGYDLELPARISRAWEKHVESQSSSSDRPEYYDAIELTLEDMRSIFDPVVDKILDLIGQKVIPHLKAMLIVGGFAGSPYLIKRVKETFSSRVGSIIVPHEPGSAICCGAVTYGLYGPDVISSRISKNTYGIGINRLSKSSDPDVMKFTNRDGISKCRDVFDILTRKGDEVPLNYEITKIYYPMSSMETAMSVALYSTPAFDPQYTTEPGVREEGRFRISHPPLDVLGELAQVEISLYFGRTTIEVKAVGRNFGDGKKHTMLPVRFERSFQ